MRVRVRGLGALMVLNVTPEALLPLLGGAGGVAVIVLLSGAWWKMNVLHELRRIAVALEKEKVASPVGEDANVSTRSDAELRV